MTTLERQFKVLLTAREAHFIVDALRFALNPHDTDLLVMFESNTDEAIALRDSFAHLVRK